MTSIFGEVSLNREAAPNLRSPDSHRGFAVWLDARLDNRSELADAVGWQRSELAVRPDADLIAALWARRGVDTLDHLVGDFALALFDEASRALFLARDPTGQRPLHYRVGDGLCRFASMPRALAGPGRAGLSLERAADFLVFVPDGATGSFFRQVESVKPGSYAIVDPGGVRTGRWWRPSIEPLKISIADAVEEAARLLRQAVQAQLTTGRGTVATQLSGGLDSGAVTAFAANQLRGTAVRPLALTAVPGGPVDRSADGRLLDEGRRAADLVKLHPVIEHRLIAPMPRSLFEDMPVWHRLFDRPIGNYCNQLWVDQTYAEAAAAGADVMLIGLAGNYSFSFEGMMALPQLLGQGRFGRWFNLASAWHRHHGIGWRAIMAQSVGPYVPRKLWAVADRFRRSRSLGAVDTRTFVNRDHPLVLASRTRATAAGMDVDSRGERDMTAFRLMALTEADPGNLNHGMHERWGIETRDPTADRRLIEFCLRLGPEHFFDGRHSRQLARRMLKGHVPEDTRLDEGKALQGADWRCSVELSRPAMRDELAHIAGDEELSRLFDHQAMVEAIEQWPSNGWDNAMQAYDYRFKLMRTLACANWLRTGA